MQRKYGVHAVIQIAVMFLPWIIRRQMLRYFFSYDIDPTAKIGFSIVISDRLCMKQNSVIGNLTIIKGLSELYMGEHSRLGNLNWVTGFPLEDKRFFKNVTSRKPNLIIERHAAIHHRNLIDCSDSIVLGEFSRVAGWRHQFLTHSIDLKTANQDAEPITIGKYCFIGTGAIILKGACLPSYSVLSAGSVLHKKHTDTYKIYSGIPALPVKDLSHDLAFFNRAHGDSDQTTDQ